MSSQSNTSRRNGRSQEEIASTRRGISERLSDPYLTAHDRWVLQQFARFLSGIAPDPDPRAVRICEQEHQRRTQGDARYR